MVPFLSLKKEGDLERRLESRLENVKEMFVANVIILVI
jgi:hypothetical protein